MATAVRDDRRGLDRAEEALRRALAAADAAPFLGHHDLPEWVSHRLRQEVSSGMGRIEKRLRLLFYFWPALTVTWIAHTVAERYGMLAQMEVYPHLAELFGVRDLDHLSRKRIAALFRYACSRLDLPLPEDSEPVDAYVVQAGAPHGQIESLARALAAAERRVGLPDIDDDTAVAAFTNAAAAALDVGHPRLRKVLEHDSAGWYARLWTALRERPEDLPDEPFARLLADAAANQAVAGPALRQPHFVWRDGFLGIELPEGRGRRWTLLSGGWRYEVVGEVEPLPLPLPVPWPAAVEWRGGGAAGRTDDGGRLELPAGDGRSLAVFAAGSGRLSGRVHFRSPDEAARPLRLPRGSYHLVGTGRFSGPEGLDAEPVHGGWLLRIQLGQEAVTLYRGSQSAVLGPVQRPELAPIGLTLRDLRGRAICSSRELHVRVIWPPAGGDARDETGSPDGTVGASPAPMDAHRDGAEFRSTQSVQPSYDLLLECPGVSPVALPLTGAPGDQTIVDLGPHLAGVEPSLRRMTLKLARRGERRALARTAAFVWFGLERTDGRSFFGRPPRNLSHPPCKYLAIRPDRIALRADTPYSMARLVVEDVDGRGRQESFEFPYPGVLATLQWLDAEGRRREQVLQRDAVIMLRPGDARLLEVTSPDREAALLIGAAERRGAFADRGRVTVPLAMVAEACRGGADRLIVRDAGGTAIDLARFTAPCEVVRWIEDADRWRNERSLVVAFRESFGAIRVRARDLLHEGKVTLELEPDGLRRRDGSGIALRLEPDHGGPHNGARLVAELADWPAGLWLLDLEARLGDGTRWQALSNLRGDAYAWLLRQAIDPLDASDLAGSLPFTERVRVFARCHKELQRCFAEPCWEGGAKMILDLWRRLGRAIATDDRLAAYWPALLLLAFVDPPLDASESWLPLVSFWEVFPDFMALPGRHYAALATVERDDALVLALLAEVAEAGSVGRFLQRWRLDPTFFTCFSNIGAVSRGVGEVECRGFNFKAYLDQLQRAAESDQGFGWSPGDQALSAPHYLGSFDCLVRRYRTLASGQGNAHRIPGAARLVRDAVRWLDREGRAQALSAIPDLHVDGAPLAGPAPTDEDEDALLQDAPRALSAIALACRLERRQRGALDAFLSALAGTDRDRGVVVSNISFITDAGRDLFAFWLLFWDVLLTTGEPCRI